MREQHVANLEGRVVSNGTNIPVAIQLRYYPDDPYAVTVVFYVNNTHRWVFSRDLLYTGMSKAIGDGDICIYPDLMANVLNIVMYRGMAHVQLPLDKVFDFLARIYAIVQFGTEDMSAQIDDAIDRIFKSELTD